MNLLKIYINNEIILFPLVKDYKSLKFIFQEITNKKYSDIDKIEFVKETGEKISDFSIAKYNNLFKENLKSKIKLANLIKYTNIFTSIKSLELIRNNIIVSGYTQFCKSKFIKSSNSSSNKTKKIITTEACVNFKTISILKKNGKLKKRYVCAPKNVEIKNTFRELKNILEDMVIIEPEMLGLGKGVEKSMDYFEDFDSLVKIDFKDFFNQISYKKFITGLKECCPNISDNVIQTLGLTVCPYSKDKKRRATYQGLPTSTISAYIALIPLYKKIKAHLKRYNIVPTIYIDDLCFKATNKQQAIKLKKEILEIIKKEKFIVNYEKCKVLFGNKTFFLGINMKTKALPKKRIQILKAALNNYFHEIDDLKKSLMKPSIIGQLNYLKTISIEQYNKLFNHHKYSIYMKNLLEI